MLITLDDERMLGLWREGAGLEPALADASIERFDGLDINTVLRVAMRAWYVRYLHDAPVDMAPVTNLLPYAKMTRASLPDTWCVNLACRTARVLSLDIEGYGSLPVINPYDDKNRSLMAAMANKFVRNGARPTALYRPGADSVFVGLPSNANPVIKAVMGVRVTDDDTFVVDERVLADIPLLAKEALNL